ncbi:MAG: glycosyl hydrolase family 28-related protein, partial [Syntrophomonas sp.]|nr:glycosyl hydrolase family 28-related protein [Syntrophomonas sp.]
EGITVETTIIEQGVTIEDVNAAIDAKVPGMIESALDERLGGEDLNPAIPLPVITAPASGAYNVRDYGTVGDGVADDTAAINAAIIAANAKGGGTVYVPDGTYLITLNDTTKAAVIMKSNVHLMMANNATFKTAGTTLITHYIVKVENCTNAKISGGRIEGDRSRHIGTTGEGGYGIAVYGSTGVTVSNMYIYDCWGDGIYLNGSSQQDWAGDILIENVISNNNRRQGLSVISVKGCIITGGRYSNTNGTPPESGIDIEPDHTYHWVQGLVIKDVNSANNVGWGLEMTYGWFNGNTAGEWNSLGNPCDITIIGCSDNGSIKGAIRPYAVLAGYNTLTITDSYGITSYHHDQ